MYQNDAMKVLTGEVRLSYANLTTPRAAQQGGEPKYSVTLLIPKSDAATKADIDAAIQAAANEALAKVWNGARPPMLKVPIYDGDGVRPSGVPFGDECKGHWVMTASTKNKPQVVGIDNINCELSPADIYSGMYLKNKDTYVYTNKTASEVIKMVAEDFQLNVGELEDTGYKIASRVEDNQTLFDIIQNALDETLKATGQMYVLYDNVGKLTLKSLGNMKLNMLVDEDTAGDYDYKSSIATQTYDKIKLSYENKETGKREIYIAQDGSHINQWGVLQYYEKLDSKANAKAMADALLDLYNTKTRTLKLQDVLGDIRVRAGTLLVVMLGLGDINVSNYLMAEQVRHTFNDGQHLMELKMRGGTFVA